jgi:hypothetical protein
MKKEKEEEWEEDRKVLEGRRNEGEKDALEEEEGTREGAGGAPDNTDRSGGRVIPETVRPECDINANQ